MCLRVVSRDRDRGRDRRPRADESRKRQLQPRSDVPQPREGYCML